MQPNDAAPKPPPTDRRKRLEIKDSGTEGKGRTLPLQPPQAQSDGRMKTTGAHILIWNPKNDIQMNSM